MARYEWRIEGAAVVRFDRWTGESQIGGFGVGSRWWPREALAEQRRAQAETERSTDEENRRGLLSPAVRAALDACEAQAFAHDKTNVFPLSDIVSVEPPAKK